MKKFKFVVFYSDADNNWYFHIQASNGKVIAQSEGYKQRASAVKACESIRSHQTKIQVIERQ